MKWKGQGSVCVCLYVCAPVWLHASQCRFDRFCKPFKVTFICRCVFLCTCRCELMENTSFRQGYLSSTDYLQIKNTRFVRWVRWMWIVTSEGEQYYIFTCNKMHTHWWSGACLRIVSIEHIRRAPLLACVAWEYKSGHMKVFTCTDMQIS